MLYRQRPAFGTLILASLFAASGTSRLPKVNGDKPNKLKFKTYPIGFSHMDITEVRTGGRQTLLVHGH